MANLSANDVLILRLFIPFFVGSRIYPVIAADVNRWGKLTNDLIC